MFGATRNAILNMKIGRRLAIVLGAISIQLALLVGLSVWSLRLVSARMDEAQLQSTGMVLAWRIASDLADINTQMGDLIISADLKLDDAQVFALKKDENSAFSEMASAPDSEKGKKLTETLRKSIESWKAANDRLLSLASQNQRAAAAEYYRGECADRYGDAKSAVGDVLEYRRGELIAIDAQRSLLLKKVIATLFGIGGLAVLIAVVSGWKLTLSISDPLKVAVRLLRNIAAGDISRDVPEEYTRRGDEVGNLAQAMQTMSENLRVMIREISSGIERLSSSSTELLTASGSMTSGSRHASDKAHSVAAAAEEMSSNITSVAAGMEQTTTNLSHVSSATDQMTSTIGEIAQNSEKARRITDQATRQVVKIAAQIDQLKLVAGEIGKVTETITEISSQTNLLALNATIEAARAGAAGKGFAVVANEIKALAQQTAAATEDIRTRIVGVQSATASGIAEIGKISEVIAEVSAIVSSIACAIEQQSAATKDIARNIAEASVGVTDSSSRVSQTSTVSREIARDIVDVDQAAGEMADGSDHVRSSAGELSAVAETLRTTIARYQHV